MNNKVLLFLFLLIVTQIDASTNHLFIVEKDFLEVKKIIQNYLSKKDYNLKERDDKILEIYFDIPELIYLKQNGYIRYRAVEYISKKNRVKYKESIDYSLDNNSSYTFSVKHYKNVKSFEEKHPLLSLIKRKERQDFLYKLHNSGIKYPTRLKEIVRVSKLIHTFELNNALETTIHISKIEASSFNTKTEFILLEIDSKKQPLIDELIEIVDIKDKRAINNEYLIVFKEMEKNIDLFYWILKYPYLVNLLYALGFGLFGLLIIYIFFGKRLKGE